jgi:type II secretory ATPase GspE/PulE/Tfp pilus assembly ATPase PilB-like protein
MAKQYVNGTSLASESEAQAIALAERLALPYVDVATHRVDPELFRSLPVEWMLRYGFIPESRTEKFLTIICADPTDVVKLDELELLTGLPLRLKVGSRAAITDILQKSESSQRVLDEATEEFRLQLVSEDEEGEETLTIDRISQDASPIIKLVDSIVFNAIQRRASDVHIETQENVVLIKYRIDGVLYQAMDPIDKRHHGTIISRIKVMSELDIAEKRIPQDGRFKIRVKAVS